MYIHEAVKKASESELYISRRSAWWGAIIKIKPTNTSDCCIVQMEMDGEEYDPIRGWQPKAEDLMADDWEVVPS